MARKRAANALREMEPEEVTPSGDDSESILPGTPIVKLGSPSAEEKAEIIDSLHEQVESQPTWEYRNLWIDEVAFSGVANPLGAEGWELVTATRDRRFVANDGGVPAWFCGYYCIFKRRIST